MNWIQVKVFELFFNSSAYVNLKPMPRNMSVESGDQLKIHCEAYGIKPEITWMIGRFHFK